MEYRKPPIVESVIEFRLRQSVSEQAVERQLDKFKTDYPVAETEFQLKVEVNPGGSAKTSDKEWLGKKLSSNDRLDMVGLRKNSFSCIRLAPYTGWNTLIARAKSAWERFNSVGSKKVISRIGVRNINRIDIPKPSSDLEESLRVEDYLTYSTKVPPANWKPISDYVIQMRRPYGADGFFVNLISGTTNSPLVNYRSLLLDIDLSVDDITITRDDEIWSLLEQLHQQKNEIFEACITDKARELFQHE